MSQNELLSDATAPSSAVEVDFDPIIRDMLARFHQLGEHVFTHDIHEDRSRIIREVRRAQYLWTASRDELSEERWDEFWDYLRDHVGGWWC